MIDKVGDDICLPYGFWLPITKKHLSMPKLYSNATETTAMTFATWDTVKRLGYPDVDEVKDRIKVDCLGMTFNKDHYRAYADQRWYDYYWDLINDFSSLVKPTRFALFRARERTEDLPLLEDKYISKRKLKYNLIEGIK